MDWTLLAIASALLVCRPLGGWCQESRKAVNRNESREDSPSAVGRLEDSWSKQRCSTAAWRRYRQVSGCWLYCVLLCLQCCCVAFLISPLQLFLQSYRTASPRNVSLSFSITISPWLLNGFWTGRRSQSVVHSCTRRARTHLLYTAATDPTSAHWVSSSPHGHTADCSLPTSPQPLVSLYYLLRPHKHRHWSSRRSTKLLERGKTNLTGNTLYSNRRDMFNNWTSIWTSSEIKV